MFNDVENNSDIKDNAVIENDVVDMTTVENNIKQSKRRSFVKAVISFTKDYVIGAIVAIIATKIITNCVVTFAVVPTGSMKPTIMEGDKVLLVRVLKDSEFERGDIIIFDGKEYIGDDMLLLKRVIGVPGDKIFIVDGVVYVNSEPIDEPYVVNKDLSNMAEIEVPEGEYFVLGDNRENSLDARYWADKTVVQSDIEGKAILLPKLFETEANKTEITSTNK